MLKRILLGFFLFNLIIPCSHAVEFDYGGFITSFYSYTNPDQHTIRQDDTDDVFADTEAFGVIRQDFGQFTLGAYTRFQLDSVDDLTEIYTFFQLPQIRFEIGATKNMAEKLHIAVPDASRLRFNRNGFIYQMFDYQNVTPVSSTALTTDIHSIKASFITAPFYGFQIGGSYMPGAYNNGGGDDLDRDFDTKTFEEGFAGTVRYSEDFGYVKFAWSAGYLEMKGLNEFETDPIGDLYFSSERRQEASTGLNFSRGNTTLGLAARFINEVDPLDVKDSIHSQEGYTLAAGLAYNFLGLSTTLSYQYTLTEGDLSDPRQDLTRVGQFSTLYTINKYFDVWTALGYADFKDETGIDEKGNKGPFFTLGFTLNF